MPPTPLLLLRPGDVHSLSVCLCWNFTWIPLCGQVVHHSAMLHVGAPSCYLCAFCARIAASSGRIMLDAEATTSQYDMGPALIAGISCMVCAMAVGHQGPDAPFLTACFSGLYANHHGSP